MAKHVIMAGCSSDVLSLSLFHWKNDLTFMVNFSLLWTILFSCFDRPLTHISFVKISFTFLFFLFFRVIIFCRHPLDPQIFINEEGVSRRLIRGAMWNMLLIFIFAALFLPSLVIGIQTHQPSGAVASRW